MAKRSNQITSEVSAEVPANVVVFQVPEASAFKIADDCQVFAFTLDMATQARTKRSQATLWPVYVQRKRLGTKSNHQLAFTCYSESCQAAMPSRELYELTGNCYPNSIKSDLIEVSKPVYELAAQQHCCALCAGLVCERNTLARCYRFAWQAYQQADN